MAATRKRKAEDRHAREALAQDNLYPRIAVHREEAERRQGLTSTLPRPQSTQAEGG